MPSALVLLSGGLDSATCLYLAKKKFEKVSAITFNYFARLDKEKKAAIGLARAASVKLIEIDVPFVKEAADFNGHAMRGEDGRWQSYVPARNLIFYSIAAHYAEFLDIKWIVGGHNTHDVTFFKDASKNYIEKINAIFKEGCLFCNGQTYQIDLPLADMDRKAIVKLAIELQVPIQLTWSCHDEGEKHCGRCYACRQRIDAFQSIGVKDPVFNQA